MTTTQTIPQSTGHKATVITALVAVVTGGALAAGLMLGFGGGAGTPAAAAPAPSTHSTVIIHDTTPAAHVTHPVVPAPKPSPAVATLQTELGQLHYYNGQIDGFAGPETTQAITYLQRDAGLPQTGHMDTATTAALLKDLAQGNNQMAG